MKRLFAPLIAAAIVASMALGGAGVASASTHRPTPLNVTSMSRVYMNRAMTDYAHMTPAQFASARAAGYSCRSIAASASVDTTQVVNAACARARTIVSGRVQHHWMTRGQSATFMRSFRANCIKYLGPVTTIPDGSVPTTATPGFGCAGPWVPSVIPTTTPSVPTTVTTGAGWGPGMCW